MSDFGCGDFFAKRNKEHKVKNTKVFGFAFYKKRTGVGGAHERKAKQKLKTKERGTKCRIKKKTAKRKYVKNAEHSQTGIFVCGIYQ